jgi:hypothetical protein
MTFTIIYLYKPLSTNRQATHFLTNSFPFFLSINPLHSFRPPSFSLSISSPSSHLTRSILSPNHSISPPPSSPSNNLPIHHHSPSFTSLYPTPNTPFTSPPFLL